MFEDIKENSTKTLEKAPYISSLMESRLLITAVICNDMKLLSSLKVKKTCTKGLKYNKQYSINTTYRKYLITISTKIINIT